MVEQNRATIDAAPEAEEWWTKEVREVANRTLLAKANSWYVGANVEGKPKVFLPYVGGMADYNAACELIVSSGYSGFQFS